MSDSNKNGYTVAKIFAEETYQDSGAYIVHSLMEMIAKMKTALNPKSVYANNVRWIMAMDTYRWIVQECCNEYGFCYQVEFSCTEPNKCSIMDIEVELIDSVYMSQGRIVKLSCVEPDVITWNHDNIVTGITWNMLSNEIKVKEKIAMPIYVGYGKTVYIENVIFNKPATIVFWSDGTKTVVKRQKGDKKFDPEKGLAMAICKKIMGNKGNFNNVFKEWIEED